MRKFKVISEYPLSPSVGDILTYQFNDKDQWDDEGHGLRLGDVETYSECFTEIVETDKKNETEKYFRINKEFDGLLHSVGTILWFEDKNHKIKISDALGFVNYEVLKLMGDIFEDVSDLERAYNRQVELQELMQANGLNLINCNGKDCSSMLIHPTVTIASNDEEEIIVCPNCGYHNIPNDCSDVYYQTH